MTQSSRRVVLRTLVAGTFVASMLSAGVASAQSTDCPAGARGAPGGEAGRSTAGSGGLAFTVGGFGTTGSATAPGGEGGSARGGAGGRGGSGTLPICNQNTNGVERPARVVTEEAPVEVPAAAPARQAATPAAVAPNVGTGGGGTGGGTDGGTGGGLARTGVTTNIQLGLAGLAFILGGMLLFFGTPAKQAILRLVGATPAGRGPVEQDWQVLGWSPPFRNGR